MTRKRLTFWIFVGLFSLMFILIFSSYLYNPKNPDNTELFVQEDAEPVCTSCQNPEGTDLLPILDPRHNLRECAKQMILLEDHLNNPRKLCQQCIKKHFLTIEALAEEGATLDKVGKYRDECNKLAENIRKCEKKYIDGDEPSEIAQDVRDIRKPVMIMYFKDFTVK